MESQKEYNFEQLMANRFNLENEYNSIKAHLLQKIKRMEQIEKEVEQIDEIIKLRSQPSKNE